MTLKLAKDVGFGQRTHRSARIQASTHSIPYKSGITLERSNADILDRLQEAKEQKRRNITPSGFRVFSMCVCAPQISPKRRHFKEEQEQLGEFTASTFFYVSLPPCRETPPYLSCYLRLQYVCFTESNIQGVLLIFKS